MSIVDYSKKKVKNIIICLVVVTSILILVTLIYFVFIKKDKSLIPIEPANNTEVDNIHNNASPNLTNYGVNNNQFDYDKIERDLINKAKNGDLEVTLRYCENCEDFDRLDSSKVKCTTTKLGIISITEFINKLKSSSLVEFVPTGRDCVVYSYSVGKDLFGFEADNPSILLVHIDNDGYAFHFPNENMIDYLGSLIKFAN